jgi:hypothetical protein
MIGLRIFTILYHFYGILCFGDSQGFPVTKRRRELCTVRGGEAGVCSAQTFAFSGGYIVLPAAGTPKKERKNGIRSVAGRSEYGSVQL